MHIVVVLVACAAVASVVVALTLRATFMRLRHGRRRGVVPAAHIPRVAVALLGGAVGVVASVVVVDSAHGVEPHALSAGSDASIPVPAAPTTSVVLTPPAPVTSAGAAPHTVQSTAVAPTPSREDQALGMIRYPWRQRLNVSISFAGPRKGMKSESTLLGNGNSEITVFERPTDTAALLAVDIAHELGHLIDVAYMTPADRQAWLAERGRPGGTWFACSYCEDYDYGNGDFAETFAADQVGFNDYRSRLAPPPTPEQLRSLERFWSA